MFFINSAVVSANESDWKELYIDYVERIRDEYSYGNVITGITEPEFKLIYIDDDNIPEIYVEGNSGVNGNEICMYYDGELVTLHISSGGLYYMEKGNWFCCSGGRMDVYYDYVYKIENGEFVRVYKGNYGAEDNANVQIINGEPVYRYYWNDDEVSEEEYEEKLNSVFDKNNAIKSFDNDDIFKTVGKDEIIRQISEFNDIQQENSENSISVILNGNKISFDVQPYIENETTMVPMRAIFEALGAEVNYDAETKTIRASKGDTIIELVTGSSEAVINGERYTLSNAVANKNGSTMVPLRFISEALGADVNWDTDTKTVTINQYNG